MIIQCAWCGILIRVLEEINLDYTSNGICELCLNIAKRRIEEDEVNINMIRTKMRYSEIN